MSAGLATLWNWKTALCSGLYRAPAYVLVSLRYGTAEAARAGLIEFLLFCVLCGLSGALVQRLKHYRPLWLARLVILVCIPLCIHACEFAVHAASGTAARHSGILTSLVMTAISEAFRWYAMRQGALLTGRTQASLLSDLARMPSLILGFLALPLRLGRTAPSEDLHS